MKTYLSLTFIFILSGCMGTSEYYQSQTAYYQAQATANASYTAAMSRPLAEMTAPDGTKFIVNNPNVQRPAIQPATNPIVDGLKTIVNSTPVSIIAGGWAAKEVIRSATNGTINNSGDGSVTTNSNNQPQLISTDGNVDQSITTIDNSATATPTVVSQEKAVIVEHPEPVIITQPDPIIVTQPDPIIIQTKE